jgi:hypothetical protein
MKSIFEATGQPIKLNSLGIGDRLISLVGGNHLSFVSKEMRLRIEAEMVKQGRQMRELAASQMKLWPANDDHKKGMLHLEIPGIGGRSWTAFISESELYPKKLNLVLHSTLLIANDKIKFEPNIELILTFDLPAEVTGSEADFIDYVDGLIELGNTALKHFASTALHTKFEISVQATLPLPQHV